MKRYDVAIIGGGAAGMMAGIWASQNGKSVIIIERNEKLGKKIYATGNGRCNLTNINTNISKYHGANGEFVKSILNQFDQFKTVKFFESLGLIVKEEDNGRIFPRNDQASSVVEALGYKLNKNNVCVKLNSLVRKINKNKEWKITLDNGDEIIASKLIITTGGKSAHQFGSSGDGYFWAKNLGHTIIEQFPALVPVEAKEEWVKNLQGLKIEARVKICVNEKIISEKYGDLLFTHFGLSGPAIMSQASIISKNINGSGLSIILDLFSDKEICEIDTILAKIFSQNGAKSLKNCLGGLVSPRFAEQILINLGLDANKKSAEVSKEIRHDIAEILKNLKITPRGVRSYKESQVTSGGIDCDEIDAKALESDIVPGLFFAGEILDVDGDSGGYNLQWAWSSGYVAGINAGKS